MGKGVKGVFRQSRINTIPIRYQNQVLHIFGILHYFLLLEVSHGVTIVESEEDDFRSEFHRNSNPKGFKDTRSKHKYYEVVRTQV